MSILTAYGKAVRQDYALRTVRVASGKGHEGGKT